MTAFRCVLCLVPAEIEAEVQDGRLAGVPVKIIAAWLRHRGYGDHLERHHLRPHFEDDHRETRRDLPKTSGSRSAPPI